MAQPLPKLLLVAGRFVLRGTWSYTLRLAEHMPEAGFETRVLCPEAKRIDPVRRQELHIEESPLLLYPLWGRVVLKMLYRRLRESPPDLIHIQSRSAAIHGLKLVRWLKIPYVQTVHDFQQIRSWFTIDRRFCRAIIAVSEAVRADLLAKTDLPPDLVTVIPPGVDCDIDLENAPVLPPDRVPVVGTAGPLETVKGFPFFLGAAAHVLQTGRDVEFLVAGAGPEEGNLRRLSKELGINEHVTFLPNLLDFTDALGAMDVFCLPSLQQGIGTIMLEAMARGRPVIATRVGGVFRVIHDGVTGLLVPPSDSRVLANRMLELLDNPDRARTIGEAGRNEVRMQYNDDQMIAQTAAVYRACLAKPNPVPVS